MELIDPWRGTTQAAQTLAALGQQIQQDKHNEQAQQMAALQLQHLQQQMQQQQMAMDEAKRQVSVRDLARDAYANAPSTVTQRTLAGSDVGPGAPVANPDYDPAAAGKKATMLADIAAAQQSAQQYPGFASLSGLGDRVAAMQKEADAIPEQPQVVEGDRPQGVTQTVTTPATHQQRSEAMAKVYESAGLLDDAKKVREGILQSLNFDKLMAQQKAEVEAGGGDLEKYYQDKQKMSAVKEVITDLSNPKTPLAVRQAALATFQKMYPGVMDDAKIGDFNTSADGGVVNKYDPVTGQLIGRLVFNPAKGELEYHAETAADSAHNIVEVTSPNGKTAQKFQYNPTTRKYDQPVGAPYLVKSQVQPVVHVGTTVPRETSIGVTNSGEMVYKDSHGGAPFVYVNGVQQRYDGKIFAKGNAIALSDDTPGLTPAQKRINFIIDSNAGLQKQKINLEAVKTPINELITLGQKLENSQFTAWNKVANMVKEGTGNTDIVAYNSKRNSVIQELANAMRGAGISEGSIQLEMKNFNNAYSPQQIQTAAQNTLEVIDAKLKALKTKPYPGGSAAKTESGRPLPKF